MYIAIEYIPKLCIIVLKDYGREKCMLETSRIYLRKIKPKDYKIVYEMAMSDFVQKYNMIERVPYLEFEAEIIDRSRFEWYIYLKDTQQVIGNICIYPDTLRYGIKSKVLSYWLDEEFTHQGYMHEALELFIEDQFEKGVEVINARIFPENKDSLQLIQKLGFIQEGYLKYAVKDLHGDIRNDYLFVKFNDRVTLD